MAQVSPNPTTVHSETLQQRTANVEHIKKICPTKIRGTQRRRRRRRTNALNISELAKTRNTPANRSRRSGWGGQEGLGERGGANALMCKFANLVMLTLTGNRFAQKRGPEKNVRNVRTHSTINAYDSQSVVCDCCASSKRARNLARFYCCCCCCCAQCAFLGRASRHSVWGIEIGTHFDWCADALEIMAGKQQRHIIDGRVNRLWSGDCTLIAVSNG